MRSRGPRMGERPQDFDEGLVRKAPTFLKWLELDEGESLRYACRYFTKGHEEDEERLMRRIMIARRNNVKDHEMLKSARTRMKKRIQITHKGENSAPSTFTTQENAVVANNIVDMSTITKRKRALLENGEGPSVMSDLEVMEEMDVDAVENTPSFQTWRGSMDGIEFTYNQKFIKGKMGHEWLLKKSIWRRMRYRRDNKRLVSEMQTRKEDDKLPSTTKSETTPINSSSSKQDDSNNENNDKIGTTVKKNKVIKKEGNKKTNDDSLHDKNQVAVPIQNVDKESLPNPTVLKGLSKLETLNFSIREEGIKTSEIKVSKPDNIFSNFEEVGRH